MQGLLITYIHNDIFADNQRFISDRICAEFRVIRPTGAAALNKLGLSSQVPTKVVYLTNGNPKRIQVGRSTIVFKKTTHKQLAVQPETVFLAIQALIALRDQADDPDIVCQLTEVVTMEKPEDIREGARLAPQRIGRILYQIANNIEKSHT